MLLRSAVNDGGRRAAIEVLADNYGSRVLQHIEERVEDRATAYAAWVEVFVCALREYKGLTRHAVPERWLMNCADRVLQKPDMNYRPYILGDGNLPARSASDPCSRSKEADCKQDPDVGQPVVDSSEHVAGQLDTDNRVPLSLRLQLSQWLWATTAQLDAERRHRGPIWTPVAMMLLCMFALLAIGFGVLYRPVTASVSATPAPEVAPKSSLPPVVSGLPAVPLGQFPLNGSSVDTQHLAFSGKSLLTGTLAQPVNDWPQIDVERIPMRLSGKFLRAAATPLGKIDLVPPFSVSTHSGGVANGWRVQQWQLSATDNWIVAIVNWVHPGKTPVYVKQLYTYYMPTGKFALVRTYPLSGRQPEAVTIAVGDGQVVVQRGLIEQVPGASAVVSLPIHVYMLHGTSPISALKAVRTIPASFGLMTHPYVASSGIYFHGIDGASQRQQDGSLIWYSVNSNTGVQQWQGAPADGMPHWIVFGQSGNPYWVETTPDPATPGLVEVLMSPLLHAEDKAESPASTLSDSVQKFVVLNDHLVWIQGTHNVRQLVVEQVN